MPRVLDPRLALLALLTACAAPPSSPTADDAPAGRTLYVRPAQAEPSDEAGPAEGGGWDDPAFSPPAPPFTTIQAAIDAAASGDTVAVAAGTYVENLTMKEGVTLNGAGRAETLLVGTVTFSGLTSGSISKLSVYDASYAAGGKGLVYAGITVSGGSATIRDVGLYYNLYGVHADAAADVTIDGIRAGGNWYAVYSAGSTDVDITNSFLYSNGAGGIVTDDDSTGRILHNTLIGNGFNGLSTYLTGAISQGNGSAETVGNNIIVSNYYGLNCLDCSSSGGYNLVWGNTTDYVNDASAAPSDLSVDPQFNDPNEGDYGLSVTSPAIDAGNGIYGAPTDAGGDVRPQGGGYDLGMDEYAHSGYDLVITEVMANPKTESTGEFIEIYNADTGPVDLAGLLISDGDEADAIQAYSGGTTILAPGEYAVIVDSDYAAAYAIDAGVTVVTIGDTNLGNGLTTADELTLFEPDGTTTVSAFTHPDDPGDGYSMEMYDLETGDTSGNWRASQCASGSSPGAAHCFPESGDPAGLIITEVMTNADDESTGEFIEIYNPTTTEIDLAGLVIRDSSSSDTLVAFQSGSTLLGPGEHALVLDSGYVYNYYLPTDIVLLTTTDATLGNSLANTDKVYLYLSDGSTLIDSYTLGADAGNNVSYEKIDYALGDVSSNWGKGSTYCSRGSSPGRLNGAAGASCGVLLITEVMANADDEDTGEYIEIYNASVDTVDLAGLVISDGSSFDTLQSYGGGATTLAPGGYALILDAEYASDYTIDAGVVLLTTGDTTLGNALAVSDEVTLYEADGVHAIDSFLHPSNPGNAVSVERAYYGGVLDSVDNWLASTCAGGGSPGLDNCVSGSSGGGVSASGVVITEVMANPLDETTGEFVEIYNNGSASIDLLYWVLYDEDAADTIFGFYDVYDTVLDPGEYAIILDQNYAGEYGSLPATALLLTTDDSSLGSGLATSDRVYLLESDGSTLADSYTYAFDPGNGVSATKTDVAAGDVAGNWEESSCSGGSSPGQGTCP